MRIFQGGLCNKYKMFIINKDFSTLSENLPLPQVMNKETDNSIRSFNIKHFQKMTQHGKCSKTRVFTLGILI